MTWFVLMHMRRNPVLLIANRFDATVRLFSSRSQMTSECVKNKKVALEAIALLDIQETGWEGDYRPCCSFVIFDLTMKNGLQKFCLFNATSN